MNEEYVKIDDVIRAIRRRLPSEPFIKRNWDKWFKENEDLILLDEEVINLPRADVAPVRHGRMVNVEIAANGDNIVMCTACRRKMREMKELGLVSRYCPSCGARMDEEA